MNKEESIKLMPFHLYSMWLQQTGHRGFPLPVDNDDDYNNKLSFFIYNPCKSNKVTHSNETKIIFNMTMFCDEEETNIFQFPNEWSESKS